MLVAAFAAEPAVVAAVAEIALVAVSLSLVLVDVGLVLPCCPAAWNSEPRNCCRAAATEVADGAEALDVGSVAAVELVEEVSLDDVNPSVDNAAESACAKGFVLSELLVDVADEESALVPVCWFARVRLTAHGSALAADPVSAEMDMHCSEWLA
ncbi:hypothetical protein [Caballeronia sp. dw_19]|uniref:hypothetical protein n=1 Tax=Caballeronia sp. dw_19 TaxID=2719791 RepID=UPI001BD26A4E|nr:hypothetical protein [Caballeronia sp. dw_19]